MNPTPRVKSATGSPSDKAAFRQTLAGCWFAMVGPILWRTVLLVFLAGVINCAAAEQAHVSSPQVFSPVGVWGCAGEARLQTESIVLADVTATKDPGVFQVEGLFVSRQTRKPFSTFAGTLKYAGDKNQFLGRLRRLDKDPLSAEPVDGYISLRAGDAPVFVLVVYPHSEEPSYYTMTRGPAAEAQPQPQAQTAVPPSAPRRELEITSLTVVPAEVEAGGKVTVKYEFTARDIPDTALELTDTATVSGPVTTPARSETKRSLTPSLTRTSKSGSKDGGGTGQYRITPKQPGQYTCRIELRAPGYPASAVKEVSFTVKPKQTVQTGAAPPATTGTAGGDAYVLDEVIANPNKKPASETNGPETTTNQFAAGSFTHTYTKQQDGKALSATFSVTFGAPPGIIRIGDTFNLAIKGTVSGQEVPDWAGGRFAADGLDVAVATPGTARSKDVYDKGIYLGGYGGPNYLMSDEATYKFSLKGAPWDGKLEIAQIATGCGTVAVYKYKRKDGAMTTPPPPATDSNAGNDNVAIAPEPTGDEAAAPGGLRIRMQSPTLVLVPGEEGWPNNALVSGWKPNGSRVEIDIPVRDLWGSLKVTRDVVVFPVMSSKPGYSMVGPEDSFQEIWVARMGAKAGVYHVPVTVRQAEAGEATTMLTIYVIAGGFSGYESPEGAQTTTPGGRPPATVPPVPGNIIGGRGAATPAAALRRIFATESVFLARLGGYRDDPGANSVDEAEHLRFANGQPDERLIQNLVAKYQAQFDMQAARGQEAACQFYADASVRLARYGVNLGDAGSNLAEREPHLAWARRQTLAKLREAIGEKARTLLAGAK